MEDDRTDRSAAVLSRDERAVLDAAERRAAALVARDADALRALMHPDACWTTHRGAILDRDAYIRGNTEGDLVWRDQRLEDVHVKIVAETAVVTAIVGPRSARRET